MRARRWKRRTVEPVLAGSIPGRVSEAAFDAGWLMKRVTDKPGQWIIYVLLNDAEDVLYVGVTNDHDRRMREHAMAKPWWGQVAHVLWEPQSSRRIALLRESELIQRLGPRHNVESSWIESHA